VLAVAVPSADGDCPAWRAGSCAAAATEVRGTPVQTPVARRFPKRHVGRAVGAHRIAGQLGPARRPI